MSCCGSSIMGMSRVSHEHRNAFFGAGTGPIYLDDVACASSASQLLECSSTPILAHNCDHHANAGVGSEGMFYFASC